MSIEIEDLLTTEEAAKILRVSPKQVRKLPIRFVRVGVRKRRYDQEDLRTYIADQKKADEKEGRAWASTNAKARRTTTRNSKSTIVGFAEALKLQPAGKL